MNTVRIPDHVLDAMAEAVWDKIGSMSMEGVRDMLELAITAALAENYELRAIGALPTSAQSGEVNDVE